MGMIQLSGKTNGFIANKHKTYKTIQIALQDAPANLTHPYVIYIKNERYSIY
ncbi:hypothetical protein [Pelosinus sp. UFO1]|uniref:hypothetical protein n=1 Tax=Pelosinus sp. UFO1 TaxID=484770 RepID=UPI00130DA199|nr:hypothetical protein [Pelosinus sp. UFO1]